MEIKGIKYIGPIFDGSGYAKACRGNIMALINKIGADKLTLSPISFDAQKPNLNEEGTVLRSLVNKNIDYNIVILHSTPEFWERNKEAGKTNIGYTIWETSKLHPSWPGYINNNADKVLVGCSWNVDVFKESGVTVPMGVVPHGIDLSVFNNITPYNIQGIDKNTYVFYSIFQWTERKNPTAMIRAYWYAFQNDENVALVLKTHRNGYSDGEKDAIRQAIRRLKQETPMDKYPKLLLITDLLSEDEMHGLHARGDCYVSLDRGEGFGLNPFTAGACSKPIIITGWGGSTEYAKEDNSYLINYTLAPVSGMPWSPWYRGDQLWAEPDILHAAETMKYVFENRNEANLVGRRLKADIKNNFTWEHVANRFILEMERI